MAYADRSFENGGTDKRYRDTAVDLDTCEDEGGGRNVGGIVPSEWLAYTVDVAEDGAYDLDLRVSVPVGGGTLHLESGGKDVTGPIELPETGGWDRWTTVTRRGVRLAKGRQVIRVSFDSVADPAARGFGEYLCNLNWIAVRTPSATPDAAGAG